MRNFSAGLNRRRFRAGAATSTPLLLAFGLDFGFGTLTGPFSAQLLSNFQGEAVSLDVGT